MMTARRAAQFLGIDTARVYQLVREGKLRRRGKGKPMAITQSSVAAWRSHKRNLARALAPKPPVGSVTRHGTRTGYVTHRCRCVDCRAANLAYAKERDRLRGYGPEVWEARRRGPEKTSPAPTRIHLTRLLAAGAGLRGIALAAGVNRKTLQGILRGSRKHRRITKRVEGAVLGVTRSVALQPHCCVDGADTWLLIEELLAAGCKKAWIAKALGATTPALQIRKDRVLKRTAERIRMLHDRAFMDHPALRAVCRCEADRKEHAA